ncbi:MAG TPA: hypothetical protein VIP46_14915 [Pyrinomonadaceae bacterium]
MPSDFDENGLAVPGINEYRLKPDANPTVSYDSNHPYIRHLIEMGLVVPTEHQEPGLGPYFREGAPYRAKITPPYEPGEVLLIRGRVWAHDTKEPLGGARMEVWQANKNGRYDNEDRDTSPTQNSFVNRARVYCDRAGYYEFETIHPGAYKRKLTSGQVIWRAPHIHLRVKSSGYRDLVTQLFFSGDDHHEDDPYIIPSLIITLTEKTHGGMTYKEGVFDLVLSPDPPDA